MPAGNFLAYLTGANGIPRKIPMIDPTTGLPIDEPVITSVLDQPPQQAMAPAQPVIEQAPPPAPVPEMPVSNIMQPANLLEGTPYADMAMPQVGEQAPMYSQPAPEAVPAQQSPQRERRSLLDTIGRISDVIARVGGAEAMYQPTLDAAQDRLRQIDLEAMQKQLLEQQVQAGQGTLADTARGRLAQALGAIAGNPRAAELWPQVAEQAGIDPQQAEAIGARIQSDPEFAATSARALGWTPPAAPSMAKELQIYGLLQEAGGPEVANAYLQNLANPDALSPYQKAQLEISLANLGLRRDQFQQDVYESERDFEFKETRQAGNGGGSNEVTQILDDFGIKLDGPEDPVADMIRASTSGEIENIASMVPGAFGVATPGQIEIGKLETIDNAIILSLAGGKLGAGVSNADRDFFQKMSGMISNPNIPAEKRLEAWKVVKQRLAAIKRRESTPPPARRRGGSQRIMPRYKPGSSQGDARARAEAEARRRGLIQ